MRALTVLAAVGLLLGGAAARADTALVHVTPKNLKENRFQVTAKAGLKHTVEFVVRRDVTASTVPDGRATCPTRSRRTWARP